MKRFLHFSYHKCLTSFYQQVVTEFASRTGMRYRHFNSRGAGLKAALRSDEVDWGSVNNTDLCFVLNSDDRASHFVRDPRDLIVSGYHYHQWCVESWANRKPFRRRFRIESDPLFQKWMPVKSWPEDMSYQEFLNTLNRDQGLILEMIWRTPVFARMARWDFSHPQVMEMRYEEIIGHETEKFEQLFDHYGLPGEWKRDWLSIVDARSIRNLKKGQRQHVRNGSCQQFRREFSEEVMAEFNRRHEGLLRRLGYPVVEIESTQSLPLSQSQRVEAMQTNAVSSGGGACHR